MFMKSNLKSLRMSSLLVFYFIILLHPLMGQSEISSRADAEEMSVRTWRALGPTLNTSISKSSIVDILPLLSKQYNLPDGTIRSFLIYTLNYTRNELEAAKVLYRYPHYHADSIASDLEAIAKAGLLKSARNTAQYRATSRGKQLLKRYWKLRVDQAQSYNKIEPAYLEVHRDVLTKILARAATIEGSQSVLVRRRSRPKNFKSLPLVIQVSELLKEYTAFINDISHYKYDFLLSNTKEKKWSKLSLSPLAKELMSATRNQRIYDLSRCYNQVNWRVGQIGCDSAVEELISVGFLERKGSEIFQTTEGARISLLAEQLNDNRRYAAWNTISLQEYEEFAKGITWIESNLQE